MGVESCCFDVESELHAQTSFTDANNQIKDIRYSWLSAGTNKLLQIFKMIKACNVEGKRQPFLWFPHCQKSFKQFKMLKSFTF